jgi:hypothetical protein
MREESQRKVLQRLQLRSFGLGKNRWDLRMTTSGSFAGRRFLFSAAICAALLREFLQFARVTAFVCSHGVPTCKEHVPKRWSAS